MIDQKPQYKIEYKKWEVYDDRTGETVYQSGYKSQCLDYLNQIDEDSEEYEHLWLR